MLFSFVLTCKIGILSLHVWVSLCWTSSTAQLIICAAETDSDIHAMLIHKGSDASKIQSITKEPSIPEEKKTSL